MKQLVSEQSCENSSVHGAEKEATGLYVKGQTAASSCLAAWPGRPGRPARPPSNWLSSLSGRLHVANLQTTACTNLRTRPLNLQHAPGKVEN